MLTWTYHRAGASSRGGDGVREGHGGGVGHRGDLRVAGNERGVCASGCQNDGKSSNLRHKPQSDWSTATVRQLFLLVRPIRAGYRVLLVLSGILYDTLYGKVLAAGSRCDPGFRV